MRSAASGTRSRAVEVDAAANRAVQSRQRAHQRRLARAVGAEQRQRLALAHLEIDVVQHRRGAVACRSACPTPSAPAPLRPARATHRPARRCRSAARRDRRRGPGIGRISAGAPVASSWPASSTTMRSHTPMTSAMSCSTSTMPMPASAILAQQHRRDATCRRATGRRRARPAAARRAARRAHARSRPGAGRRAADRRRARPRRRGSRRTRATRRLVARAAAREASRRERRRRGAPRHSASATLSATSSDPNSCDV